LTIAELPIDYNIPKIIRWINQMNHMTPVKIKQTCITFHLVLKRGSACLVHLCPFFYERYWKSYTFFDTNRSFLKVPVKGIGFSWKVNEWIYVIAWQFGLRWYLLGGMLRILVMSLYYSQLSFWQFSNIYWSKYCCFDKKCILWFQLYFEFGKIKTMYNYILIHCIYSNL